VQACSEHSVQLNWNSVQSLTPWHNNCSCSQSTQLNSVRTLIGLFQLATGSDWSLAIPCGNSTLWSELELNLRPTVNRPVCLSVGPPFVAHDQILHAL
jgi:hypothetical protein